MAVTINDAPERPRCPRRPARPGRRAEPSARVAQGTRGPSDRAPGRRPARRLRASSAARDRRTAARRRRRLDRCRQVDTGQRRGGPAGQPGRRAAAHDQTPVLVYHPGDAEWFTGDRILPDLARVTAADLAAPGTLHLVADEAVPQGLALLDTPDVDSVVSENRQARDPAPGRRRPVVVRDVRRPLRRRRAVGPAARRRRPQRRRRGRPRPRPRRSGGRGASPPGLDARSARPRCRATVRGRGDEGRRRGHAAARTRGARLDLAAGPCVGRGCPRGGRAARSTVPWPGSCAARHRWPSLRTTSTGPPRACERLPKSPTRTRPTQSTEPRGTAASSVARCSPAGRTSSAPVSSSARWRTRSVYCATGSQPSSGAAHNRQHGSRRRSSTACTR